MITLEWIKPSQIRDVWPQIKEGLATLEDKQKEWLIEDIYMALKLGNCNLHKITDEHGYIGFIITQQQENYGVLTLHIWVGYSNRHNFNVVVHAFDSVREWAKSIDAKKITFGSHRKGWAKQAEKVGFTASPNIIYQMEL